MPLVVSGEGFHPRETRFQPASVRAVEIDLLPDGAGFDLDFFDHIFRNLGRDGTERWTVIPDFEIWTRIYECREGEIHDCDELIATEDEAPGQFLKIARDTIVADAPKYTGGKIQSFQITTRTHLPGEHLTLRDYFIPGKTTIVFIKKHDASFAWLWPYESGALYSVTIQILNKHRADAAVYSHELAHAMGFSHPAGYENVPLLLDHAHGGACHAPGRAPREHPVSPASGKPHRRPRPRRLHRQRPEESRERSPAAHVSSHRSRLARTPLERCGAADALLPPRHGSDVGAGSGHFARARRCQRSPLNWDVSRDFLPCVDSCGARSCVRTEPLDEPDSWASIFPASMRRLTAVCSKS